MLARMKTSGSRPATEGSRTQRAPRSSIRTLLDAQLEQELALASVTNTKKDEPVSEKTLEPEQRQKPETESKADSMARSFWERRSAFATPTASRTIVLAALTMAVLGTLVKVMVPIVPAKDAPAAVGSSSADAVRKSPRSAPGVARQSMPAPSAASAASAASVASPASAASSSVVHAPGRECSAAVIALGICEQPAMRAEPVPEVSASRVQP